MKTLVLNGSLKGDDTLDLAYQSVLDELKQLESEIDTYILHETKIASCLGCFKCWTKTPGICVSDDAGREIAMKVMQSDLVIWLTPVTFGGYSSELKKALDRIIPDLLPFFSKVKGEIRHKQRYDRFPGIAIIGVLPEPDEASGGIFRSLVERNSKNFYLSPFYGEIIFSSQTPGQIKETVSTLIGKVGVGK